VHSHSRDRALARTHRAGAVSEQVMIRWTGCRPYGWLPLARRRTRLYPSDGEDLGQVLTGRTGTHNPRKLCWRFKAGSQLAIRDGDRNICG